MEPHSRELLNEAIAHLEQAVRQAPGNPRYTATLGEAWLLHGDAEAALAPLQSSFAIGPIPRTGCLLAEVLHALGRRAEAESIVSQAIEEAGGFHRAYAVRAEIRRTQDDFSGALDDLEAACALAPHHEDYRARRDQTARELRVRAASGPRVAPTPRLDIPVARTERFDLREPPDRGRGGGGAAST